jgi:hypothetical protein
MRPLLCLTLLSTTILLASGVHGAEPAPTPDSEAATKAVAPAESADASGVSAGKAEAESNTRSELASEAKAGGNSQADSKPEPASNLPSESEAGSEDKSEVEVAQSTPYERAAASLILGNLSGLRFESEVGTDDGAVQSATAVAQGSSFSVNVRTQPQADADNDGAWLVQDGAFRKRSEKGLTVSETAPASIRLVLESLALLPSAETALSNERAPAVEVVGVACQPRSIKLTPPADQHFAELGVCVDEAAARIVRVNARTKEGERLSVKLSQQNAPTPRPESNGRDWTSEFPIAKPEDRVPDLKFKDCPELITLLPKGCEGFVPWPSGETKPQKKSDRK